MSATGHIFCLSGSEGIEREELWYPRYKNMEKGYMKRTYNTKNDRRLLSNSLRLKGSHAFLSLRQVISFCRLMFLFFVPLFARFSVRCTFLW